MVRWPANYGRADRCAPCRPSLRPNKCSVCAPEHCRHKSMTIYPAIGPEIDRGNRIDGWHANMVIEHSLMNFCISLKMKRNNNEENGKFKWTNSQLFAIIGHNVLWMCYVCTFVRVCIRYCVENIVMCQMPMFLAKCNQRGSVCEWSAIRTADTIRKLDGWSCKHSAHVEHRAHTEM